MTDPRGPVWRRTQNGHKCNYPGCEVIVAGRLWGCRDHWSLVPLDLRDCWMAAGTGSKIRRGSTLHTRPAAKFVDREIKKYLGLAQ